MNFKLFKATLFAMLLISIPACNSKKLNDQSNEKNTASVQPDNNTKESTQAQIGIFSLPINATLGAGKRVHIGIQLPEKFRSLQKIDAITTKTPKGTVVEAEFVPFNDTDPYAWSRIITVHSFIGFGVSAKEMINDLTLILSSGGSDMKVLDESVKEEKMYTKATCITTYTSKGNVTEKNRRELLYAEYYSGPLDCSGFQHAICLSDGITEEQALKEVHEFAKNNVKIVTA